MDKPNPAREHSRQTCPIVFYSLFAISLFAYQGKSLRPRHRREL
jgi:hypothetical protein